MKKSIITTLLCIFASLLFANEYEIKKVQEFPMGNYQQGLYLRKYEEVAPQDDFTKNYLIFTKNGDLRIYQADSSRMIYLSKDFKIEKEQKMNLLISPYNSMYTDNYLLMSDMSGRMYLFDKDLKQKAYFETFDVFNTDSTSLWLAETYYDEATDILFFRDTSKNMHSIVHPGMNDTENRKNYKNPDQTLELFGTEVTINGTTIRVTKSGSLFVNGNYTYWGQLDVGNYVYQNNHNNFLVYEKVNPRNNFHINISDDVEEIESAAVHPSGDIYILRMNWQTNKHTLYCIENTWDPEWREQWYNQ